MVKHMEDGRMGTWKMEGWAKDEQRMDDRQFGEKQDGSLLMKGDASDKMSG